MISPSYWSRHPKAHDILERLGNATNVSVKFLGNTEWLLEYDAWKADFGSPTFSTLILELAILERFLKRVGYTVEKEQRLQSYAEVIKALRQSPEGSFMTKKSGRKPELESYLYYLAVNTVRELFQTSKTLFVKHAEQSNQMVMIAKTKLKPTPILYISNWANTKKKVANDTGKQKCLEEFSDFELECFDEMANQLLSSDLDEFWNQKERGEPLAILIQKFFVDGRLFRLPFSKSLELWQAVVKQPFFRQLMEFLAGVILKNLEQLLKQEADSEHVILSFRLVLGMAYHCGITKLPSTRKILLQQLQTVLIGTPINQAAKDILVNYLKTLNTHLDQGILSSSILGSLANDPNSAGFWAYFTQDIQENVNTDSWSVRPLKTLEIPKAGGYEVLILSLHQTIKYDLEWAGTWQLVSTTESHATRKVMPNMSCSFLESSWMNSKIPNQTLEPRLLYLTTVPDATPILGELDASGSRTTLQFKYPQAFQSGETFATLYTAKTLLLAHSFEQVKLVNPNIQDRIICDRMVGKDQYQHLVYRMILPSWYPLTILTCVAGKLQPGFGSFFCLRERDIPEDLKHLKQTVKPYFSTSEFQNFVDEYTTFTVCHLPEKIILELQVRPDPKTGFILPGRFGIAFQRPTEDKITKAFLNHQQQKKQVSQ